MDQVELWQAAGIWVWIIAPQKQREVSTVSGPGMNSGSVNNQSEASGLQGDLPACRYYYARSSSRSHSQDSRLADGGKLYSWDLGWTNDSDSMAMYQAGRPTSFIIQTFMKQGCGWWRLAGEFSPVASYFSISWRQKNVSDCWTCLSLYGKNEKYLINRLPVSTVGVCLVTGKYRFYAVIRRICLSILHGTALRSFNQSKDTLCALYMLMILNGKPPD